MTKSDAIAAPVTTIMPAAAIAVTSRRIVHDDCFRL